MDRKAPILIVGGLVMFVIIAMLFAKPKVSWIITYYYKSKAPYGTNFIFKLLESKYEKENFKIINEPFDIAKRKLEDDITYDYIKIGYSRKSSQTELAALLSFIEEGNNAFVSLEDFDLSILDSLFQDKCEEWKSFMRFDQYDIEEEDLIEEIKATESVDSSILDALDSLDNQYFPEVDDSEIEDDSFESDYDDDFDGYWINHFTNYTHDSTVGLNFTDVELCREDSSYYFFNFVGLDTFYYQWNYFDTACLAALDSFNFKILGEADSNKITFFEIPIGKGRLYIHTIPLVFTNVELLSEDRLTYVEKVLSYLNGDKMLWDVYKNNSFNNGSPSDVDSSSTPLSYLLSEPALRWSIYLMVFAALLFILFRAKRRQQYIPVIEPNVNTSIDYVEMMGQLYFEEKDHHFIASQMWKKFLDYIRVHYYITPKEGDTSWIKKVADKSLVNEAKITGILRAYEKTKFETINEDELINFYDKLNYFYSNCK
ncbi:MAG: hypothetical protein R2728_05460 [Chitinophagales bacterium]